MQGNTRAVNSLLTEAEVLPKMNFMLGKFDDVYEKQKESAKGANFTNYWVTLVSIN